MKKPSTKTKEEDPARKPFYSPRGTEPVNYSEELGDPGEFPFTRGIHSEMYRARLWTMRQYAGFGSAEESNQRYRYLLSQGTTGLSVAFDLPTQIGLDSDHPLAQGEVGRVGVAINSLEDMEVLLDEIPLGRVSTSMTINSTAPILLALYLVVAKKRGIPWKDLRGTVQNDILKEYVARGTYIYPPKPSLRLVTDLISFCQKQVPQWNAISVSGYHIREAGATAPQELAFTLANAVAYVEASLAAGSQVDEIGPRISFFFASQSDFFEEISKFRAARRMWARIMRNRFGARSEKSLMLRFHTQTAGSTLTAQQPDNNTIRVALQALSAVLGGTQSLHTNAKDEALALPTEEAANLALRIQQVLAFETAVTEVADPLGGSWFVESLTNDLEEQAGAYLDKIDSLGGALAAIEAGFVQREIQESAYRQHREMEKGKRVVVGINRFSDTQTAPLRLMKVDEAVEKEQVRRLTVLRKKRDHSGCGKTLDRLRQAAKSNDNLLPFIVEAVEAYATVGEISQTLAEVFGTYEEAICI